jgi:hypothetical protein
MNKSTTAVAALVAVTAFGTAGVANAATVTQKTTTKKVTFTTTGNFIGANPIASVLSGLVTKGTITQAQSDAIVAALDVARAAQPAPSINGGPGFGGHRGAGFEKNQSVILSTLGITATDLQTARTAGKSLATLAGAAKTQALIDALVAAETADINSSVTAGRLTQAQATQLISGLVAHVTAEVNQAPGAHFAARHGAPLAPATPATPAPTSN